MKIMIKKLGIILLAIIMIVPCLLTGCSGGDKVDGGDNNQRPQVNTNENHIFEATETDDYLVKDGKTDYVLIYPAERDALDCLKIARQEFVHFFHEATGISLLQKVDTGITYDANARYISLGDNEYTRSAGIDTNAIDLSSQGARIETKGKSIFLYGNTTVGTLYAVYDFMQYEFNFDFYYTDCYDLDTGIREIKLKNYNIKDIPDIEERTNALAYSVKSLAESFAGEEGVLGCYRNRTPYDTIHTYMLPIHKVFDDKKSAYKDYHNSSYYLPYDQYKSLHPNWYSTDGVQLCYTARGDEAELQLMKKTCAQKIISSLKLYSPTDYPLTNTVTLSIEDGGGRCQCPSCSALAAKYVDPLQNKNCESAAIIMFLNDVSDIVDDWMAQPENEAYRRDLKYLFMPYGTYNDCPVKYNETTDTYEPIDENVRLNDNVGVWYCGFAPENGFFDGTEEAETKEKQLRAWGDMTEHIWVYGYDTRFAAYFSYRETYAKYNDTTMQLLKEVGVDGIYICTQAAHYQGAVCFQLLKGYLNSKLSWNCTLNTYELTIKFFKAMYKDGWQEMLEMYEDLRIYYNEQSLSNPNFTADKQPSWPQTLMNRYMALCDSALAKVEKYKESDMELYKAIEKHINMEWAYPAYNVLVWYSDNYSAEDIYQIKKRFRKTVEECGLRSISQFNSGLADMIKDYPTE